jgi:hypothetical protein
VARAVARPAVVEVAVEVAVLPLRPRPASRLRPLR